LFIGLACVVLAGAIAALKVHNLIWFWYAPLYQLYSVVVAAFIFSRVLISLFYRPPKDHGHMPAVSVVIAAKNEEAHIADTIHHCFRSRYPSDRLEVIAIDDGSTDGTWAAMSALETQYPRFRAFRFEKNKGKREGMAFGAEKASGEILVYVDSDSYVEPEGVYRIVQPFVNPNIGAVSGHILAFEEDDNFISKMEAARYYVAHRIMKAAESVFGVVTCCPGAFAAYRRSAVLRVLEPWLHQTFLGTRATFGDDRSLTNYMLRTHEVIYHSGARCGTYVPRTWRQFFKQQLRWKKSWSRETTIAMRLMYKKHPIAAVSYYLSILLTVFSPLMAIRALVVLPLMGSVHCWPYLAGLFLMYSFLCLLYCYHTRAKTWYYGLAFAALYLGFLCFQNYYAMFTVRQNQWGTR
jgi:hyaluronan synthase